MVSIPQIVHQKRIISYFTKMNELITWTYAHVLNHIYINILPLIQDKDQS